MYVQTSLESMLCRDTHGVEIVGCIYSIFEPIYPSTLRWRYNGRYSVSNHLPHDCSLNHLFRPRSKKTAKLRVTDLCVGNSPGTGEFRSQMDSNAENVSIWWRHHALTDFDIVLPLTLSPVNDNLKVPYHISTVYCRWHGHYKLQNKCFGRDISQQYVNYRYENNMITR